MSQVAMKNKAFAMHTSHSRGSEGFSLNGRTRFKGPGQVSLAESVTRTPFRGTEPKGHGGGSSCRVGGRWARKCGSGKYPQIVSNSGSACTPQTFAKPSTMTTKGMLETRFMGILHGTYPKTWVKSIVEDDVVRKAAAQPFHCPDPDTKPNLCGPYAKNTAPETYGEHALRITAQCVRPDCEQRPFPFRFKNAQCGRVFLTWQEAKAAGAMCEGFQG